MEADLYSGMLFFSHSHTRYFDGNSELGNSSRDDPKRLSDGGQENQIFGIFGKVRAQLEQFHEYRISFFGLCLEMQMLQEANCAIATLT